MYKPRVYKRHITVWNFYPKIISAFTSFCFCADQTQDGLLLKKKKPIFCTSTIGFHWKMQVRETGLVRLSLYLPPGSRVKSEVLSACFTVICLKSSTLHGCQPVLTCKRLANIPGAKFSKSVVIFKKINKNSSSSRPP